MKTTDIINAISFWTNWAQKPDNQRYDIALLKIWIQFEKFMGELFIIYATGGQSETGYSPELKLHFLDEEHLNAFLRENNKKYIDYLSQIQKLSKHIFIKDPFDAVFLDETAYNVYNQIQSIRNYIAHESGDAKSKMIQTCFGGNSNSFLEPKDFLLSKKKNTGITYYTYFLDTIKNISELLADPIS